MSSFSRACFELSNSIKGLRLSRSQSSERSGSATSGSGGVGKDAMHHHASRTTNTVTNTITRALKSATNRVRGLDKNGHLHQIQAALAKRPVVNPWEDQTFLLRFFMFFSPCERCTLAQVCKLWRDALYQPRYWMGITPIVNCKDWSRNEDGVSKFYHSLQIRGFDSVCLFGATDKDVQDFILYFPHCRKNIRSLSFRCSNITDTSLETLLEKMLCVYRLELSGCNELTEAGLWSCLNSKIVSLSITDCINVADDSVGAIAQLLPSLYELNLQAYHVTDAALSFFSAKQSYTLGVLRLHSCWEITNHGIVNVVHALPNLTVLSLSGCSKITDDGIELIAENLRKLRSLDLSWCLPVVN